MTVRISSAFPRMLYARCHRLMRSYEICHGDLRGNSQFLGSIHPPTECFFWVCLIMYVHAFYLFLFLIFFFIWAMLPEIKLNEERDGANFLSSLYTLKSLDVKKAIKFGTIAHRGEGSFMGHLSPTPTGLGSRQSRSSCSLLIWRTFGPLDYGPLIFWSEMHQISSS